MNVPVLIDFGDGVERSCQLIGLGPGGSWTIRSPEGAVGYYSGPFQRVKATDPPPPPPERPTPEPEEAVR